MVHARGPISSRLFLFLFLYLVKQSEPSGKGQGQEKGGGGGHLSVFLIINSIISAWIAVTRIGRCTHQQTLYLVVIVLREGWTDPGCGIP